MSASRELMLHYSENAEKQAAIGAAIDGFRLGRVVLDGDLDPELLHELFVSVSDSNFSDHCFVSNFLLSSAFTFDDAG